MITFPPAKINLGLRILRKRSDGYHDLESCLVPVGWRDILEVLEGGAFSFQTSGLPIPGDPSPGDPNPGDPEQNLCVRAYRLLQQDFGLPPIQVHLHKIIPMGAGLGGGSADAAHMLLLLNELFSLSLEPSALEGYAARLGSDCPFFVRARPQMAYGTGTTLENITLDLSGQHAVLVYPNVAVATAAAYAQVIPRKPDTPLKELLTTLPPTEWKDRVVNDFEASVFPKYPELAAIKEELYEAGAYYTSLSGSGSTLYGLFENPPSLPASWEGYTVWEGVL